MARKSWRNHLWIVTCVYFLLGLYNIAFAWLGLVFFLTPLLIALLKGDKTYCNKYCDRGRLFRFLGGRLGASRGKPMFAWMKSRWFRYLFMAYFFAMFGSVVAVTWLVASQARDLDGAVKLFQAFRLPLAPDSSPGALPDWAMQFAFGFYSLMLTSLTLGLITMLLFKPRSWCVYCPMGTMTQAICKLKRKGCEGIAIVPEEAAGNNK
ncbi:4Fe-4S binding protein [Desulfovibrio sp. OttesenSCG-928-C14]|nr:4Fe-4S binding protein [Desulfovibrio sp. OttesenSCG-928-C14]